MCQIFCCCIIQGVSFNYHHRNVRSRSQISRSRSRLLLRSLGLGLVSKYEPGLGLGGYGLDYITAKCREIRKAGQRHSLRLEPALNVGK